MRRRGDWLRGFGQRFAIYDPSLKQALTNRHVIWLHAVSVGEVNLCTQLINALGPTLRIEEGFRAFGAQCLYAIENRRKTVRMLV